LISPNLLNKHIVIHGEVPAIQMKQTALRNLISNFFVVGRGSCISFFNDIKMPGSKLAIS